MSRATLMLTALLLLANGQLFGLERADEMQGSWRGVTMEREGVQRDASDVLVTFEKDQFTVRSEGNVLFQMKYTANPKPTPKTIDFTDSNNEKEYGIYELNDNELKLIMSEGKPEDRPTKFSTKEHKLAAFIVMKREKK
jgi:uncharacterized protein (TIGR03067 family)